MKNIIISMMILAICSLVSADEITVDIDRIALLAPGQEDMETESSRIAIYFDLPDSLLGRDIVMAQIQVSLDFTNFDYAGDTKIELRSYAVTDGWSAESANWANLADDIDGDKFYTFAFDMADEPEIYMDITEFVQAIGDGADNYGLMLIPQKFDQRAFHVNRGIVSQIENNAGVQIMYH